MCDTHTHSDDLKVDYEIRESVRDDTGTVLMTGF